MHKSQTTLSTIKHKVSMIERKDNGVIENNFGLEPALLVCNICGENMTPASHSLSIQMNRSVAVTKVQAKARILIICDN